MLTLELRRFVRDIKVKSNTILQILSHPQGRRLNSLQLIQQTKGTLYFCPLHRPSPNICRPRVSVHMEAHMCFMATYARVINQDSKCQIQYVPSCSIDRYTFISTGKPSLNLEFSKLSAFCTEAGVPGMYKFQPLAHTSLLFPPLAPPHI